MGPGGQKSLSQGRAEDLTKLCEILKGMDVSHLARAKVKGG